MNVVLRKHDFARSLAKTDQPLAGKCCLKAASNYSLAFKERKCHTTVIRQCELGICSVIKDEKRPRYLLCIPVYLESITKFLKRNMPSHQCISFSDFLVRHTKHHKYVHFTVTVINKSIISAIVPRITLFWCNINKCIDAP